jgi:hypothetical protein
VIGREHALHVVRLDDVFAKASASPDSATSNCSGSELEGEGEFASASIV